MKNFMRIYAKALLLLFSIVGASFVLIPVAPLLLLGELCDSYISPDPNYSLPIGFSVALIFIFCIFIIPSIFYIYDVAKKRTTFPIYIIMAILLILYPLLFLFRSPMIYVIILDICCILAIPLSIITYLTKKLLPTKDDSTGKRWLKRVTLLSIVILFVIIVVGKIITGDRDRALEKLKSPFNGNRLGGLYRLEELKAKECAKDVAKLLKDMDPDVRWEAIEILGEFDAKEYADDIKLLLNDEDEDVRKAAEEVLKKWNQSAAGGENKK